MIIYAKCIRGSQIAQNHEEFLLRQNEEYTVYCTGETSISKIEDRLYCVPLNYIFDCLKYGDYIAIIEVPNEKTEYPKNTSYLSSMISMNEQKVLRIIKAESREAIDFVADNVQDQSCITNGYVTPWFNEENKRYFEERIPNYMK